MLEDLLTLTNVTVTRETKTPDQMGGFSVTTAITTLSKCQIWQAGQQSRGAASFMSDKMAKTSTHLLVMIPGEYTFTVLDKFVTKGSEKYLLTGHADDVMNMGEVLVVGLERVS